MIETALIAALLALGPASSAEVHGIIRGTARPEAKPPRPPPTAQPLTQLEQTVWRSDCRRGAEGSVRDRVRFEAGLMTREVMVYPTADCTGEPDNRLLGQRVPYHHDTPTKRDSSSAIWVHWPIDVRRPLAGSAWTRARWTFTGGTLRISDAANPRAIDLTLSPEGS